MGAEASKEKELAAMALASSSSTSSSSGAGCLAFRALALRPGSKTWGARNGARAWLALGPGLAPGLICRELEFVRHALCSLMVDSPHESQSAATSVVKLDGQSPRSSGPFSFSHVPVPAVDSLQPVKPNSNQAASSVNASARAQGKTNSTGFCAEVLANALPQECE